MASRGPFELCDSMILSPNSSSQPSLVPPGSARDDGELKMQNWQARKPAAKIPRAQPSFNPLPPQMGKPTALLSSSSRMEADWSRGGLLLTLTEITDHTLTPSRLPAQMQLTGQSPIPCSKHVAVGARTSSRGCFHLLRDPPEPPRPPHAAAYNRHNTSHVLPGLPNTGLGRAPSTAP